MQLASRQTIQHLCKEYGIVPTKSSGQHFLISSDVLNDIVDAAELTADDAVLEIGPGLGTLTTALLDRAASVVAVELDPILIRALTKLKRQYPNLTLVQGDVLGRLPDVTRNFKDLEYVLVANLPYNITSQVLRIFLENTPRPRAVTVLIQKEVAERVVAPAGQMSMLSLAVQFYGQPRIIRDVPASDFWPEPAVESAVLRIENIGKDASGYLRSLGSVPAKDFFRVAKIGFAARRKQIHNTLAAGLKISPTEAKKMLTQADIEPSIRPQQLSVDQWIRLAKIVVQ